MQIISRNLYTKIASEVPPTPNVEKNSNDLQKKFKEYKRILAKIKKSDSPQNSVSYPDSLGSNIDIKG